MTMQVIGGDWPLTSQARVSSGRIRVSSGLFSTAVIALPDIDEIESISAASLGRQPARIRAAASLALGQRTRHQIVLITLKDGRLLLCQCTLKDVQALLALSARMNARSRRRPEPALSTPAIAAPPAPGENADIVQAAGGEGLGDGPDPVGETAASPSPDAALPAGSRTKVSIASWSSVKIYQGLAGLLVLGGCVYLLGSAGQAPMPASNPAPQPQPLDKPPSAAAAAQDRQAQETEHAVEEKSFIATRKRFQTLAKPCDDALVAFARPQSQYGGYNSAVRAQMICRQSAADLLGVSFQVPIPEDARSQLDDISRCFAYAYGQRAGALDKAKAVLDGDQRPSLVSAFRSDMEYAMQATRDCGDQLAALEVKYGYVQAPLEDILGKRGRKLAPDVERQLREKR